MEIVYGPDDVIGEFVARLVPGVEHYTDWGSGYRTLGIVRDTKLVCGVVFDHYNGFDCVLSIGATDARWATKGVVKAIIQHGFDAIGCVRLTALTSKKNKHARDFLKRIGFQEEGMKRLAFDGKEDAIHYGGTRRDLAKWL